MVSHRKFGLLQQEATFVQRFLDDFEEPTNGQQRVAKVGENGELIYVRNFPLPDGFEPDYIDLLVLLDDFPARPPIGVYVLHRQNGALIEQISNRFNAFRERAFHNATPIPNFTWICYHYENNSWRYHPEDPARGDNTAKFLAGFFAEMSR
ncbi:hypothetical protein [Propionivibrio dicarboxylicus]|uniref:Uncharacterized protein n=1 Tax=Propionivibrio dicarboxylicus TaxID=83767 RepID=A0A1G8NWE2_9RHOO|nr:hypothetical protein [Propionivibrio dicarboxylicus]SDI84549.1 hypothetical protein SAMN05660652_04124 [Propionivibrio dicarboxylicus]